MPVPASVADLPVVGVLADLGAALERTRTAVLVAPPGAGKTTVVPLWLLDQPWLAGGRIVMLEPRRLATRAAARRMAALLGDEVGGIVGYQTRDERRIGPTTRIEVVTEGVLTRRLQHDPDLPGVAVVIFDEVHERNLPTDLGLALALDVRTHLRPDLALVAMSATPDTARLAALLGDAAPAPVVESEGRQFPVDIRSLPPAKGVRLDQAVADSVMIALRDEPGDVLVFLPGIGEIRRVERFLAERVPADVDVHPLAGALSLVDQDRALAPSPPGRRRVVLSTDIAESSLTVDGVRVVVDAGQARVPRFDPRTGMTRLTTVATSRASADQRAGRAGRTEPGVCYRLWSKLEQSTRLAHLPAEITQVDLAGLVLELAAWNASVESLAFLDRPQAKAVQNAQQLLVDLGALDTDGRPTATGRAMLALPVHPRLARMVVDAAPDDQALACVLAALVDERDVLRGRADELPADLGVRVRLVARELTDDRADRRALDQVRERAYDIARRARVAVDLDRIDAGRAGAVLALAFPDRVAVRRSQRGQFQLRTGGGAWVTKDDPLAGEPFVVAADLDGNRTSARIRLAAGLDATELEAALTADVERRRTLVWDKQRNDLVERIETRLGNMVLADAVRTPEPGLPTVEALVERVRATRLAALDLPSGANLRARVALLAGAFPDGGWPDWSDRALVASLDEWLAPYLQHATSRTDLDRLDLGMLLVNQLSWDQQTDLAELTPAVLDTPAGRSTPIDYTRDHPTASVRVQDLFGTRTHPCVLGGRVPITLELLSPADRPIQVTADLPSFWAGSWAEVRKEMAGRYPKHQWPDDPAAAPPKRLKDR
jgi:ATP-dependent helicase HrpB